MKKIFYLLLALSVQSVFAQLQSVKVPVDAFTEVVAKRAETFGSTASSSVLSSVVWHEQPNSLTATTGIRTFVGRLDGKLVGTFSYNRKGEVSGEIQLEKTYDITSRNGIVDIAPRAEASSNCGVEETSNASGFKLSSFESPRLSVKKEENKKTEFKITDGKYRLLRLAILDAENDGSIGKKRRN